MESEKSKADRRLLALRKFSAMSRNDESIFHRSEDVVKWVSIKILMEELTKDSRLVKKLNQQLSVEENIDLMLEVMFLSKSQFMEGEMYKHSWRNPEMIVGHTGIDGIVESRTIKDPRDQERINPKEAGFIELLNLIILLILQLKDGIKDPENLILNAERVTLDWFLERDSVLVEQIKKDIGETQKTRTSKAKIKSRNPRIREKRLARVSGTIKAPHPRISAKQMIANTERRWPGIIKQLQDELSQTKKRSNFKPKSSTRSKSGVRENLRKKKSKSK